MTRLRLTPSHRFFIPTATPTTIATTTTATTVTTESYNNNIALMDDLREVQDRIDNAEYTLEMLQRKVQIMEDEGVQR